MTLGCESRGRPAPLALVFTIDSVPHTTYQSRKLSTGDYVCINLGNERKAIFINTISDRLDLDIIAEVK